MTEVAREQLTRVYHDITQLFLSSLPRVLSGLAIVVSLVVAAKLVEIGLRGAMRRVKADAIPDQLGLSPVLQRLGITQPVSSLLPRAVFILLLFLFAQTAADLLGLTPISQGIGAFLAYLPNVGAALVLLVAGGVTARFVRQMVSRAAEEAGIDYADSLGSLVSGVVFFVVAIMAVAQLRVDTEMVRLVAGGILGAFALAFGVSFGFGSRDITRSLLAGFYARKVFRLGDPIELRGEQGRLRAITPIQTLIENDQRIVAVSNAVFLEETVRQPTPGRPSADN